MDSIIPFSRTEGIFQFSNETTISNNHCFFWYDKIVGKHYIIDYGTKGNGSTNGTFIKIKDNIPFLLKEDSTLRIVSLPKINYDSNNIETLPTISKDNSSDVSLPLMNIDFDYSILFAFNYKTNKQ